MNLDIISIKPPKKPQENTNGSDLNLTRAFLGCREKNDPLTRQTLNQLVERIRERAIKNAGVSSESIPSTDMLAGSVLSALIKFKSNDPDEVLNFITMKIVIKVKEFADRSMAS